MLVCSTRPSGLARGGDGAVMSVGAVVGSSVVGKVASEEGALAGGADPVGVLGLG